MPKNPSPQKPSHIIYHVKDTTKLDPKGRRKGIWTRVGAVWPTKSGNGSRIVLEYQPQVDGRMYMLPWPAHEKGKEEEINYEITTDDLPVF